MDDYDEEMASLESQIRAKRELRDAQHTDDELYWRAQSEATNLTARLYELDSVAPRLRELDAQIASWSARSRGLQARLDERRRTVSRTAMFAGVLGALALIVCLAFPVSWYWWAAWLLLAPTSAGLGVLATRMQLNPPDELRELAAKEELLRRERRDLLPQN